MGRRNWIRELLTVLWRATVTGIILLATLFVYLSWAIGVAHTPDLTTAQAGALISARPEFNRYAKLVKVSKTTRGHDSLKDCCYSGQFTFLQFGSNSLIDARAEFRYFDGEWHLQEFWHGQPPHVETVWVGQGDQPPRK